MAGNHKSELIKLGERNELQPERSYNWFQSKTHDAEFNEKMGEVRRSCNYTTERRYGRT